MSRLEFSAKTKKAAYERSGGYCEYEECGLPLRDGRIEYHHVIEAFLSGDNSLDNCLCICTPCHRAITRGRAPVLAKTERNWKKARGIRNRSRFAGSKDSPFKKKLNGQVVPR